MITHKSPQMGPPAKATPASQKDERPGYFVDPEEAIDRHQIAALDRAVARIRASREKVKKR